MTKFGCSSQVYGEPIPKDPTAEITVKNRLGLNLRTCSLALASGAILLHSSPAAANGRFPEANQIVFSPTDPNLIVLRTTYGILPSRDNGSTWQYICEEALGVGPTAIVDPPLGLTHNDSLLAGAGYGLSVSPDTGCNWNCIGGMLANQVIVDLAVRPDNASSAVAITGTFVPQLDSGQEFSHSQIFETVDDGVSWAPIGTPIDPMVLVQTVDVTKTDPNRLYVSGTRGYGSQRTASLFVSKDKGASWTEWRLPAAQWDPATEDSIFIGGVDPTNADRVYLRSSAQQTGGQSRLTVVNLAADGTPTFTGAHLFDAGMAFLGGFTGEMLGFALSEDGSRVYIGSREDGLWSALASDLEFQKISPISVQCLATRGAELWACSAAVSGFVAGVSTDEGKTFTAKLPLIGTLSGPIACAPSSTQVACGQTANASQCGSYYTSFCESFSCDAVATSPLGDAATASDASRGGGATLPPESASSSCDLAVPGQDEAAGLGAGFLLLGSALFARNRRRRR
jgi:hypothetical protein